MASINIDQPVSTPAHEWASDTFDAMNSKSAVNAQSSSTSTHAFGTTSVASTPGLELPGAFPRETHSQQSAIAERTPHAAAASLADAAPPKSTAEIQETARGYLPNVDVQGAMNTAKGYLPESVVGALGSVLPASMIGNTQPSTETVLDPTSGAKPALTPLGSGVGTTSFDNASTTAIPPSTRKGSFTSESGSGTKYASASGPQADSKLGSSLDGTTSAKPAEPSNPLQGSTTSAPIPGADTTSTSIPLNAANAATALHIQNNALPTPPLSEASTPPAYFTSAPQGSTSKSTPNPPGLPASESLNSGGGAFPLPSGSTGAGAPTPPPKEESHSTSHFDSKPTQPSVNTAPGHDHIITGSVDRARIPGTAPAGGEGAKPSLSPASSLTDGGKLETGTATTGHGGRAGNASASSSDASVGGTKKEGKVKGLMNKVKGKLHRGN